MKSLNKTFSVSCIFALLISLALGCGGPSGTGSSATIDNGVVKFNIDGVDWISGPPGHPDNKYEEEAITDGATMVKVEAFAADGSYLTFTVYSDSGMGTGTYPITSKAMMGFYEDEFSGDVAYVTNGIEDNPGSITIVSMTEERIKGTFNFLIRNSADPDDTRQITDGSFDLRFSYY